MPNLKIKGVSEKDEYNAYRCKGIIVGARKCLGNCVMCRHSQGTLVYCKVNAWGGEREIPICRECIELFRRNLS